MFVCCLQTIFDLLRQQNSFDGGKLTARAMAKQSLSLKEVAGVLAKSLGYLLFSQVRS